TPDWATSIHDHDRRLAPDRLLGPTGRHASGLADMRGGLSSRGIPRQGYSALSAPESTHDTEDGCLERRLSSRTARSRRWNPSPCPAYSALSAVQSLVRTLRTPRSLR